MLKWKRPRVSEAFGVSGLGRQQLFRL